MEEIGYNHNCISTRVYLQVLVVGIYIPDQPIIGTASRSNDGTTCALLVQGAGLWVSLFVCKAFDRVPNAGYMHCMNL